MAHRLAHINRRKQNETNNMGQESQQSQPVDRQTNQNIGYQPNFPQNEMQQNLSKSTSKKIPRPIHYPVDKIFQHDKNSFRKGLPAFPPVDSLYKSQNTYDAGPQFCRPTSAMMQMGSKKFNFPIGVWIQPFGSQKVHNIPVTTPLRCQRCKAYVNPYFKSDNTNKSCVCNICGIRFQIPQKVDRACLYTPQISTEGVIDFTVEDSFYFRKRRDLIKVIFAVQMTLPTIESGLFSTIIQSIKSTIQNSTFQSNIRFGVVYYNDDGVSFMRFKKIRNETVDEQTGKSNVTYTTDLQSQPIQYQAHVKDGIYCCPLSDKDFVYNVNQETQKQIFLKLLDSINQRSQKYIQKGKYCNTANYYTTLKCLQQSFQNQTGRIMLFSQVDPRNGPGAIRNRNEEQLKNPLKPIHTAYMQLAKQLIASRVGVDHYVFTKEHTNPHQLQTTQFISSLTGGNLTLYAPYRPENHSEHLYYSIFKAITKEYVYDVDFTCRISNGLQLGQFLVNDGVKESRDVSASMMDPAHSLAVTFVHEEKIEDIGGAYLQFAMMYTNGNGQRKIRVINYRYHLTDKLQQIHQAADYAAFANILARKYVSKLRVAEPIKVREQFMNKLVTILAQYRQQSHYGLKYSQLSIHPNLAPALAYLHSIFNSKLFLNWNKATADYRVSQIHKIHNFGFLQFALRYYPHVFSISTDIYQGQINPGDLIQTEGQGQEEEIAVIPQNIPLTRPFLKQNGAYLYNTGDYLVILVMPQAPSELLNDLFENQNLAEIQQMGLPQSEVSSHNIRINYIVNQLRRRNQQYHGIYQPLLVKTFNQKILFGDLIANMLKEDYPELNYTSFLESLHRSIQSKGK